MSQDRAGAPRGILACVGIGMLLGAHISPRARAWIARADVVFALVSDAVVELWLQGMRPDLRSLQPYYGAGDATGKPRRAAYDEMVAAMLGEVRAGRRVCAVFYGHPGVFAQVPHRAIAAVRGEGLEAVMEPGISAEDCLYADLGLDPGAAGCQHHEATQFMLYERRVDPSACLVLWQVGIAGDVSTARAGTGAAHRQVLLEVLYATYAPDTPCIVYEAATLPIEGPRIDRMPLSALVHAELRPQSTLVVPPTMPLRPNDAVRKRIAMIDGDC